MKIKEIMSLGVVTVKPSDDVKKAASLICLKKISGLPVVDDEGKLVGIISEKDILRAIYPTYREFFEDPEEFKVFSDLSRRYSETTNHKIKEIFNKRIISADPDMPLLKALSLMITKRVRRLPVVDDQGKLIGIVSQGDIHQALFNQQFLIDKGL